jgi:cytoskeletal protein RodZ
LLHFQLTNSIIRTSYSILRTQQQQQLQLYSTPSKRIMGIPCNRLFVGLLFVSFICILQYSRILGTTTAVRDSPQARSSGPPPSSEKDVSSSPKSSDGEAAANTEQTSAEDSPPLSKSEETPPPPTTTKTEEAGTAVVVAQATPQSRNATPKQGWIYEPKNLGQFWDRMGDRPFISTIYPHLSRFERVLDSKGHSML